MRIRVHEVKVSRLGRSEVVGRQRVMQEGEAGWAGLAGLEWQGGLATEHAQPLSQEGIRRQIIISAHHRELGPVQTAFNDIVGPAMKPLIRESDQAALDLTQPANGTHTHELKVWHGATVCSPVPYEAHLQQWNAMAVGGHGNAWEQTQGDGGERGSTSKKRQKAGFTFRT